MNRLKNEFHVETLYLDIFPLPLIREHDFLGDFDIVSPRFRRALRSCGGDKYVIPVKLVSFQQYVDTRTVKDGLLRICDKFTGHRFLRPVEFLCLAQFMFLDIKSSLLITPGFVAGVLQDDIYCTPMAELCTPKILGIDAVREVPFRKHLFTMTPCSDVDLETFDEEVIDIDICQSLSRPSL